MSKRKGYHHENEIKKILIEKGIPTRRIVMSGALKNHMPGEHGDLKILDRFSVEVKYRANGRGFVQLEGWMQDCDILFLKRALKTPMVMMNWETFLKIMRIYADSPLGLVDDKENPTG